MMFGWLYFYEKSHDILYKLPLLLQILGLELAYDTGSPPSMVSWNFLFRNASKNPILFSVLCLIVDEPPILGIKNFSRDTVRSSSQLFAMLLNSRNDKTEPGMTQLKI